MNIPQGDAYLALSFGALAPDTRPQPASWPSQGDTLAHLTPGCPQAKPGQLCSCTVGGPLGGGCGGVQLARLPSQLPASLTLCLCSPLQ